MNPTQHLAGTESSYELIELANGTFTIRSGADKETFHPAAGATAEAEALYVEQLKLRQRLGSCEREFVVWDVGLGGGGNSCTAFNRLSDIAGTMRMISFDRTLAALRFAHDHANKLGFPMAFRDEIGDLIQQQQCSFKRRALQVQWEVRLGDFPTVVAAADRRRNLPAPDAIFFDAFSPARNPEMWTLPLFRQIFLCLDPLRPCALATFSRSTLARVTMLLAGFFVGVGTSVSGKEETTCAANSLDLIDRPLDVKWLERARVSKSAEPLQTSVYKQTELSPQTWERLRAHAQFA